MFKYIHNIALERRNFIKLLALILIPSCKNNDHTSIKKDQESNLSTEEFDLGNISQFNAPYTALSLLRIAIIHSRIDTRHEYKALSLVCTHQNCIIKIKDGEQGHICPCHNSEFDKNGTPTKGPATKPLIWKKIESRGDRLILFPNLDVNSDWSLLI